MSRRLWLLVAVLMIPATLGGKAKQAQHSSRCEAPQYFNVCNPYVPGVLFATGDKRPISVIGTWHDGPAERAGVCPGDKIIAVNGVKSSENTSDRMLHEIVATKPTPVVLTVQRGNQTMELRVRRVRETTLAALSHQKYLANPVLRKPILVPLEEKRAELARYADFFSHLEERQGFTMIDGFATPVGTPPQQVRRLRAYFMGGPEASRVAGFVGPTGGKNSFGFTEVVLKDPSEVLIDRVYPNSPAHHAGLLPGDSVLEINGRMVSGMTFGNIRPLILEPDQPRTIRLKVDRSGEQRTLEMASEPFENLMAADLTRPVRPVVRPFSPDSYFLGIEVLYNPNPREAMVANVNWPSPAFNAGLHLGDSILAINGKAISDISRQEIAKLSAPEDNSPLKFEVLRLGNKKRITVKPVT